MNPTPPVTRINWPPLLRGIGTTIILFGTLIAFLVARQDYRNLRPGGQPLPAKNPIAANGGEAKPVEDNEDVAQMILENRYFEWMGFIGTAIIASSFYVEAFARKPKST